MITNSSCTYGASSHMDSSRSGQWLEVLQHLQRQRRESQQVMGFLLWDDIVIMGLMMGFYDFFMISIWDEYD